MNTRIQVEHPITEAVTGVDLVKAQIEIAAGRPLGFEQADVVQRGWAIECRIYAEDPENNFLPAPGRIAVLRVPSGIGIRDDSGVYEGFEVSTHYDPILSKLVAWGSNRDEAIDRMLRALGEYVIVGPTANIAFHRWALQHPAFRAGDIDTGFIAPHFKPGALGEASEVEPLGEGRYRIAIDGRERIVDGRETGAGTFSLLIDHAAAEVSVTSRGDEFQVAVGGRTHRLRLLDERARLRHQRAAAVDGAREVRAAMPGKVVAVLVDAGARVERGQGLLVIEAMKMENEIAAPRAGTVAEGRVKPGQAVEAGELLARID